jgi:hypothetical protein
MAEDPYELLGVRRDATLEEVRTAYHRAALKCHPDAFQGDTHEAERLFREVTEAYETVLQHLAVPEGQPTKALSPADLARIEMARALVGPSLPGIRRGYRRDPAQWVTDRLGEACLVVGVLFLLAILLMLIMLVVSLFSGSSEWDDLVGRSRGY